MARIDVADDQLVPMSQHSQLAEAMTQFTAVLMRGDSPLSPGERDLIGAFVSARNDCLFCTRFQTSFAVNLLEGGEDLVEQVKRDYRSAPISEKLKALLHVAGQVREGGQQVTDEAIEAARAAGATDREIHDTVLVAAEFSKFNRYMDALEVMPPEDPAVYQQWVRAFLDAREEALSAMN